MKEMKGMKGMKDMKGMKKMLLRCLVFTILFVNITSTGFAKSNYFKGSETIKVRDGILTATVERGKQLKGSKSYTWRIIFSAMYDGYRTVESFNTYANVVLQQGDVNGYKTYVLRAQKGYIISALSDETKETRFFDFSFPKASYRQGTIKAEVHANLELRGFPESYRVYASTQSKIQYE